MRKLIHFLLLGLLSLNAAAQTGPQVAGTITRANNADTYPIVLGNNLGGGIKSVSTASALTTLINVNPGDLATTQDTQIIYLCNSVSGSAPTTCAVWVTLPASSLPNLSGWLANITALRALTSTFTGTVEQVKGIQGGLFYVNASDTTSSDNGFTIYVDAAGRRWYRVVNSSAIYSQWGGISSANSDNSAALVAGDTLAGPNGTFILSGGTLKVTSNIALSSYLTFQSGTTLQPASGITISTNGHIVAPISQIFDTTQGGTISGTPIVADAWCEWFGCEGGVSTFDSSVPLNQTTVWLSQANVQGTTGPVGYGRANLNLLATTYFLQHTWFQLPFINYVGIRATTADTTSPLTYLPDSRGTIIRATAALYGNDSTGDVIDVATGDITERDFQVVGTAAINGNPSNGFDWGAGTSGVSISGVTVYTCVNAHVFNGVSDFHMDNDRMESNTEGLYFAAGSNVIHYSNGVSFASSNHIVLNPTGGVAAGFYSTNSDWIIAEPAGEYVLQVNPGTAANIDMVFGSGDKFYAINQGVGNLVDMEGSGGTWVGTGQITGNNLTVQSTSSGTITQGMILTSPGVIINGPRIVSGSGTSWVLDTSETAPSSTAITGSFKQRIQFTGASINSLAVKYEISGSGDPGYASATLKIDNSNLVNVPMTIINRYNFMLQGSTLDNSTVNFSSGTSTSYAKIIGDFFTNLPSGTAITTTANMDRTTIAMDLFSGVQNEIAGSSNWSSALNSIVWLNNTDSGNILPTLYQSLPTSAPTYAGGLWNNSGVLTVH